MTPSCFDLWQKSIFNCEGAVLGSRATEQQGMLLHSTLTQPLIKARYCVIVGDSCSTGMQNNIMKEFSWAVFPLLSSRRAFRVPSPNSAKRSGLTQQRKNLLSSLKKPTEQPVLRYRQVMPSSWQCWFYLIVYSDFKRFPFGVLRELFCLFFK